MRALHAHSIVRVCPVRSVHAYNMYNIVYTNEWAHAVLVAYSENDALQETISFTFRWVWERNRRARFYGFARL